MKFNVNVNIKLRDVCLVTAGVVVGAAAISLFNQHNVKQVKKEFNKIVDKETKTIKKEIKNEIKENINLFALFVLIKSNPSVSLDFHNNWHNHWAAFCFFPYKISQRILYFRLNFTPVCNITVHTLLHLFIQHMLCFFH